MIGDIVYLGNSAASDSRPYVITSSSPAYTAREGQAWNDWRHSATAVVVRPATQADIDAWVARHSGVTR